MQSTQRLPQPARQQPPPRITEMEPPEASRPKSGASSTAQWSSSTNGLSEDRPPVDGQPLTEENERIRASVPRTITDVPEEEPIGDQVDQVDEGEIISPDAAELQELMSSFAFEEEDVKEQLAELCDWIAEILAADHWKLSERQKRIIGRPITLLLNSLWARLQDFLPRFFAEWCDKTPGLFASMTACAFVFGPKLMKQIKINREKKRLHMVAPPGAPEASRSSRPTPATGKGPIGPVIVQDAPPASEKGAASGITWD